MNNKAPIPGEKLDEIQGKIREWLGADHEFVLVIFPARQEDGVSNSVTTVSIPETIYSLQCSVAQFKNDSQRPNFTPPYSN